MSINSLITNLDRALLDARELEKESALLKRGERKLDLARPRIWVGPEIKIAHWYFNECEWTIEHVLYILDVFVPDHLPKPECSPADFTYLDTCSVVDWKVP